MAFAFVINVRADAVVATVPVGTEPQAIAIDSVTNKIYVANLGNTVTVINGASDSTTTVTVGASPVAIAVNPATNKIYVANGFSDNVTVINGANNSTTNINVGIGPEAIAVNSVTNKIYVMNEDGNNVTVINGATNATTTVSVGTQPIAIAVNPATNMIYVVNGSSNNVTVINGATDSTSTVSVGSYPYAIAVNSVNNLIYVANSGSNDSSVTIIDGVNNATMSVSTGREPTAIAVNPITNLVYVVSDTSITVINGASLGTATIIPGLSLYRPYDLEGIAVNPATNKIYVANGESDYVTVINGANNSTTNINVGIGPEAIAVNSVTNKIYVMNEDGNSVTVIDGTTIPGIVTLSSPTNGSLIQTIPLTLSWGSVAEAASYAIQVSTTSNFASIMSNQNGLTSTSMVINSPPANNLYYWEVNATNASGTAPWSGVWSFQTQVIPSVPVLSTPFNGLIDQATALTLNWNTSLYANTYALQVSTLSNFASTISNQTGLTKTSDSISGLSDGTTYYWHVNASNSYGISGWSSVYSFTTNGTGVLPLKATTISKSLSFSNSAITYELPTASSVSIVLYDIQGRQVRQLVNATQNAGPYRVNFNRARVTAGYYIVEFKAGAFVVQKKLALVE
jgi:YVTN family beta-propeller protein